jgi:hypothetical protein
MNFRKYKELDYIFTWNNIPLSLCQIILINEKIDFIFKNFDFKII